jgi:glycosyltransferase involved in cell wall biosynthesis
MKILYLHQYYNGPNDSGSTRSYEMATRMVRDGHAVTIVTSYRGESDKFIDLETFEDGIRIIWIPVKYSNNFNYIKRIYAFLKFSILSAIKSISIDADLVFATSTPLTICIPAIIASKIKKAPLIFEVRDLWPEMPIAVGALKNRALIFLANKLELFAYRNSSAIIALSPGMKEGIIKTGFPGTRIAVISNACDVNKFDIDYNINEYCGLNKHDGPVIVYAGTLGLVNDVSYLVDIARELTLINSNIRIVIFGDGSQKSKIINHAIDSKVFNKNLFVFNPVPKSEMPKVFAFADMGASVFLDVPEMRANSANKFFDTLASGRPVLINYGGWMHELILKYSLGISLWRKSSSQSALELDKFFKDSVAINYSRSNAKLIAYNVFDRDLLYKKLISTLYLVANGNLDSISDVAPDSCELKIN